MFTGFRYTFRMLSTAPTAQELRPFVQNYVQIRVSVNGARIFWPIPARSFTCIEFTFGEPYEIFPLNSSRSERTHPSTLIGAKTYQRIRLQLQGHVETFTILFRPTGLQRLFSLQGLEIVNDHPEADAVFGPEMNALRNRLGNAGSFQERVAIADQYLKAKARACASPSGIDRAAQEITSKRGCARVQDLADKTGMSLRQFERKFAQELGITPKLYARIVRFEAAVDSRIRSPGSTWTDIAHTLGYHDQMHMVHDFHLLSGEAPSSLLTQIGELISAASD